MNMSASSARGQGPSVLTSWCEEAVSVNTGGFMGGTVPWLLLIAAGSAAACRCAAAAAETALAGRMYLVGCADAAATARVRSRNETRVEAVGGDVRWWLRCLAEESC